MRDQKGDQNMKRAVGIDLGTTNSSMAIIDNGQPRIIPMGAQDDKVLKSALYFTQIAGKDRVFTGSDAIHRGTEVGRVEYFKQDFKRDIAKNIESETPDKTRLNSTILSALLLHEFKKRLDVFSQELNLEEPITDAVITVPAYFTSDQRAATKLAGRLANFNVLRIINEPTAAAIAYVAQHNISGKVLVYDLGGGTFDVTIMDVSDQRYDILATDGNHRLGGLNFDQELVKFISAELEKQGLNMTRLSDQERMQLRYQAEKMKIQLSVNSSVFYEKVTAEGSYGVEVTRDDFKQITSKLLKDTQIKTEDALMQAGLIWSEIDHVLLVGGSTRMPVVREMIEKISGQKPRYDLNPDTIVSEGASIIADLMVNHHVSFNDDDEEEEYHIRDVTSHGLGILFKKMDHQAFDFVGDYYNSVIVDKNTQIPHTKEKEFFAVADGQQQFKIRVTEGNYTNPMSVRFLGDLEARLDQPRLKGQALGKVVFHFDDEQIIHITIYDSLTQKELLSVTADADLKREKVEKIEEDTQLRLIFEKFIS